MLPQQYKLFAAVERGLALEFKAVFNRKQRS